MSQAPTIFVNYTEVFFVDNKGAGGSGFRGYPPPPASEEKAGSGDSAQPDGCHAKVGKLSRKSNIIKKHYYCVVKTDLNIALCRKDVLRRPQFSIWPVLLS